MDPCRNTAHQPLSGSLRVGGSQNIDEVTGRTPPKTEGRRRRPRNKAAARGGSKRRAHQLELKHVSCPIPSSAVCMRTLDWSPNSSINGFPKIFYAHPFLPEKKISDCDALGRWFLAGELRLIGHRRRARRRIGIRSPPSKKPSTSRY